MRIFNEQEKWLLNRIATLKQEKSMHSISLGDICTSFLKDEYIEIHYNMENDFYSIDFRFNGDKYSVTGTETNEKEKEIENKIIDTIFLLEFLKENHLLFELTENNKSGKIEIVKTSYNKEKHLTFPTNFDKPTRKLVIETLFNKRYYIKQELDNFIKVGFITKEDYHFNKSQKATWTGIVIAFLVGVISILLGAVPKNTKVSLESGQFDKIEASIQLNQTNQYKAIISDSLFLNSIIESIENINKNLTAVRNVNSIKLNPSQFDILKTSIIETQKTIRDLNNNITTLSDSIESWRGNKKNL